MKNIFISCKYKSGIFATFLCFEIILKSQSLRFVYTEHRGNFKIFIKYFKIYCLKYSVQCWQNKEMLVRLISVC